MDEETYQTIPSGIIPVVQEVWIESGSKVHPGIETGSAVDALKCLCRICASEKDDHVSIFGVKGKKLRLASKINKNLPITVTANDKLPIQVCQECIAKLEVTIELINTCVKAQLQLAEILVSSEKQQSASTVHESYGNDDHCSVLSEGDNIDMDEMFPPTEDLDQRKEITETVDDSSVTEGSIENKVTEVENDEKETNNSLENGTSSSRPEVSVDHAPKSTSNEVPKKPKFKVVVVKVKNNGKMPDHKQIAQTLRELKLDLKNADSKKSSHEVPTKEGHVVILNKSLNICGENLNIDGLKNNPSFEVKFDSVGNKEVSVTSSKSKVTSGKDDEVIPEDHSYTHWNQRHEKCEYCSETFVGRVNLIAHQMKDHKSNVFCCFRCDQVFYDSKEDYDKHVQAHCISSNTRVKKTQQPILDKEVAANVNENQTSNAELKVTAVARVSVDEGDGLNDEQSEGVQREKVHEVRTYKPGLRMKLSKEFEGMDPNLKNKIVGTIQKLVRQNKLSNSLRNVSCPTCNIKFMSAAALETHRRIKHDERLPCRFCSRLCRSEAALKKHEDCYHFKEFKCEICAEQFKSRSLLRKHELGHFGERPYKCNQCCKSYTSRGSLQIHVTTHSNEKPYLCDKCGKGFKHVSNLNAHRRTHSDDPSVVKAHRCTVCSKAFRCQFLVREHMRLHTGDKPFVCEHCGKSFYKKQQLRQHSAVHSPTPLFKCNVCGAKFNRKGNMMQHQKRHGKEGVFTCKICGETFASVGLVLRHRRSHGEEGLLLGKGEGDVEGGGGVEQDPELALACKCDLCGKFLSSKVSLTLHMRTHTGERPYTCSLCNKSFSQSTSLKVHKRTHTGERPFVCGLCARAFSSRAALTVHERGHTGERPYPCKDCGKSFRCAAALKQHASTHSDDRPYPCEYCLKKFRRKEALEIHLRTHTGERPYGCRTCGRRFAQKGDAKKHERTHEKVTGRRQSNGSTISPNVTGVLLDDCSNNSFENQPLSLVEITTDPESVSVTDQGDSSIHPSLQLEHSVVEHSYPNLPPGTIIINAQDLMTSSSEITVVAEEDLNNHILGNSISIQYEEC